MSYIDTIKHELVGTLNGLPIYHPLETVTGTKWGDHNFSCSPQNLVIGGGAGEHPGLVIHHLDSLVASYVLHDIQNANEHFQDRYISPPENTIERLLDISDRRHEALEFCGWSMENIYDFIESAKSPVHSTPLQEGQSPEEWIRLSIGEFVYFSLGEINPLQEEINSLPGLNGDIGYWMCNVTCPPPNYIKTKKKSLSSANFQLHGFFRWDYKYPPEE